MSFLPSFIRDRLRVIVVLSVLLVKGLHDDLEFEGVVNDKSVSFVRTLWFWNVIFTSRRGDGNLKLRFVIVAFVPVDGVLVNVNWFRFSTYGNRILVPSIPLSYSLKLTTYISSASRCFRPPLPRHLAFSSG